MMLKDSPIVFDEKSLQYLRDWFLEHYMDARNYRIEKGYNTWFRESYRFYRGIPIKKPEGYEFQANYWRPLTFGAVETIHPRLLASIFATDPWFRYLADDIYDQTGKLSKQYAKGSDLLTKIVYRKLSFEVPFMLQIAKALKNALVYSRCLIHHPWLNQIKSRYIRDTNGNRVQASYTYIDSPWCQCIAPWDDYPQPETDSLREMDRTIFREMVSPNQLYQRALNAGSPYFMEQVMKVLEMKEGMSYPALQDDHYKELDGLLGLGTPKKRLKMVELLHMYGTVGLDKDPSSWTFNTLNSSAMETHIVLANRMQIVAAGPNIYDCQEWPLTEITPCPNTHGLLGIPIPEMTRDTQLEANDNMNNRLDLENFLSNRPVKVRRHSDLYEKLQGGDIILYPGSTLPVDNMDDVGLLELGGIDPSIFMEDKILRDEFDRTLGIENISGDKPHPRTASGQAMVYRNDNYRFDAMLKHMLPNLASLMQKIGYFTQQFALPLVGKDIGLLDNLNPRKQYSKNLKYSDIQVPFETSMLGSTTRGDRSYHFALLQSLRQLLGQDPNININELDRQLLEEGELKNIDLILQQIQPTTPATNPNAPGANVGPVVGGIQGNMPGQNPVGQTIKQNVI